MQCTEIVLIKGSKRFKHIIQESYCKTSILKANANEIHFFNGIGSSQPRKLKGSAWGLSYPGPNWDGGVGTRIVTYIECSTWDNKNTPCSDHCIGLGWCSPKGAFGIFQWRRRYYLRLCQWRHQRSPNYQRSIACNVEWSTLLLWEP